MTDKELIKALLETKDDKLITATEKERLALTYVGQYKRDLLCRIYGNHAHKPGMRVGGKAAQDHFRGMADEQVDLLFHRAAYILEWVTHLTATLDNYETPSKP